MTSSKAVARAAGRIGGVVGLLILLALHLAAAVPGIAAAQDATAQDAVAGPVLRGTGVRASEGGQPRNVPVAEAPAAVNVVGLTVSGGTARVELAGPYEGLGPGHVVAVALSAPGAPLRRLVLAGDGRTSDELLTDGRFVPQGAATVSLEGAVVAFALPVESAADWGVQAEAWLPDRGLHSHTAIAPLGALTGDLPPLATSGVPADAHGPAWYLPARALPEAVRPVAVAIEERNGGPAVVVEMAAPPQAVAELDGEPVTAQAVTVVVGGALNAGAERVVADPAAATGTVSIDGTQLIFPFAYRDAPSTPAPAGLPADAPARTGTAVATPVTCGNAESYFVDVAMAGGQLVLTHFDGDVAQGPVDAATGAGTLSSPDGRIYQVQSVAGATITVPELRYGGCSARVTITLEAAFEPAAPPTPVAITDTTPLHVESQLVTASGGVVAVGPEVPILSLLAATTAAAPVSEPRATPTPTPTPTAGTVVAPQERSTEGAKDATAVAELVPYGAGAAALVTLVTAAVLLLRRPRQEVQASDEERVGASR